jgi:hypothetical protein
VISDGEMKLVQGLIHPDERLLWRGVSQRRIVRQTDYFSLAFGLIGISLGVGFLISHFAGPHRLPLPWGLAALAAGIATPLVNIGNECRRRYHSVYALTTKRALVVEPTRGEFRSVLTNRSFLRADVGRRSKLVTVRFGDPLAMQNRMWGAAGASSLGPWHRWEEEERQLIPVRGGRGPKIPHLAFYDVMDDGTLCDAVAFTRGQLATGEGPDRWIITVESLQS